MSRKRIDIMHHADPNTKSRTQVVNCGYCHGSGRDPGALVTRPCPSCGGKGKVRI